MHKSLKLFCYEHTHLSCKNAISNSHHQLGLRYSLLNVQLSCIYISLQGGVFNFNIQLVHFFTHISFLFCVRCMKSEVTLVGLTHFSACNANMVYLLNNSIATFPSIKRAYYVNILSINQDKMNQKNSSGKLFSRRSFIVMIKRFLASALPGLNEQVAGFASL